MKKEELTSKIKEQIHNDNVANRQHKRAFERLRVNERLENAKKLVDVTQYDSERSLHIRVANSQEVGLTLGEVQALHKDFPDVQEAINWLSKHKRSRTVYIGRHNYKAYKSDREALGDEFDKWDGKKNGWKVDLYTAQVWTTSGKEASYSPTKDNYINVNGKGLHRLVMIAYLLVRGRSDPKYRNLCKEIVRKDSPYQVHHLFPAHTGDREFNSIFCVALARVEKNRPNQHQIYNNIGREIKKYMKKNRLIK